MHGCMVSIWWVRSDDSEVSICGWIYHLILPDSGFVCVLAATRYIINVLRSMPSVVCTAHIRWLVVHTYFSSHPAICMICDGSR